MTSHYLNLCWFLVNLALENNIWRKLNQNTIISIQENWFEKVICKKSAIFFRPHCVNDLVKWPPPSPSIYIYISHSVKYNMLLNTKNINKYLHFKYNRQCTTRHNFDLIWPNIHLSHERVKCVLYQTLVSLYSWLYTNDRYPLHLH